MHGQHVTWNLAWCTALSKWELCPISICRTYSLHLLLWGVSQELLPWARVGHWDPSHCPTPLGSVLRSAQSRAPVPAAWAPESGSHQPGPGCPPPPPHRARLSALCWDFRVVLPVPPGLPCPLGCPVAVSTGAWPCHHHSSFEGGGCEAWARPGL